MFEIFTFEGRLSFCGQYLLELSLSTGHLITDPALVSRKVMLSLTARLTTLSRIPLSTWMQSELRACSSPSCPSTLRPQEYTLLKSSTITAWSFPAPRNRGLLWLIFLITPAPSENAPGGPWRPHWLKSLSPQEKTSRSSVTAKVKVSPTSRCRKRLFLRCDFLRKVRNSWAQVLG